MPCSIAMAWSSARDYLPDFRLHDAVATDRILSNPFAPREEKWVWHHDQSADSMLGHHRESRLKFIFGALSQALQALLESIGRGPKVRQVRLEVRVSRISKERNRVDGWQKLVQ